MRKPCQIPRPRFPVPGSQIPVPAQRRPGMAPGRPAISDRPSVCLPPLYKVRTLLILQKLGQNWRRELVAKTLPDFNEEVTFLLNAHLYSQKNRRQTFCFRYSKNKNCVCNTSRYNGGSENNSFIEKKIIKLFKVLYSISNSLYFANMFSVLFLLYTDVSKSPF